MKALVIAARPMPQAGAHDLDDLQQMEFVSSVLEELGLEVARLLVDLDLVRAKREIETHAPDFVFNLVEGLNGKGGLIHLLPSLLETMGVPYTGCPGYSLMFCSHKPLAKSIMRIAGLPTPDWITSTSDSRGCLTWERAIIKSVHEHGSLFLDEGAVCDARSEREILDAIRLRSHSVGEECFAEAYIQGREFNVSLLGGPEGVEVLPISEIVFRGYNPERPQIVCYRAKWDPSSFEYHNTPRAFNFPDRKAIYRILEPLARKCWEVFGLRGYARVDFRLDGNGCPWILEVNPNPCLSPDAGFMASARERGLSPEEVIGRIIAGSNILFEGTRRRGEASGVLDGKKREIGHVQWREGLRDSDLPWLQDILESDGVFSSEEIQMALDVAQEALGGGESGYNFILAEVGGRPIGFACFGPVPCTKGTFDLYWIAVHGRFQKMGLGRGLLDRVENKALSMGAERLVVDTSSRPDYRGAHRLYLKAGYKLRGEIEDFYSRGDHKLIFSKELKQG